MKKAAVLCSLTCVKGPVITKNKYSAQVKRNVIKQHSDFII